MYEIKVRVVTDINGATKFEGTWSFDGTDYGGGKSSSMFATIAICTEQMYAHAYKVK